MFQILMIGTQNNLYFVNTFGIEVKESTASLLKKIEGDYKLGYHKAAKMSEINLWAKTWAVTELPDEKIRGVHIKPYKDLKKAVADALAEKGENAKIIVLPYGSMIVPKV